MDKQNREIIEYERNSDIFGFEKLSRKSRTRFALAALGLSFALHEPFYHYVAEAGIEAVRNSFRDLEARYDRWLAERKRLAMIEAADESITEAYQKDLESVENLNKDRKPRIEDRKAEAERFKKNIIDHPDEVDMSTIFFPIEYYSQGVEDEEMRTAKEVFRIKSAEIKIDDPKVATKKEFNDMVETFMPAGSGSNIVSSAVYTLARELGPGTQDCVARARIMVMAVAKKYPELADNLYFQQFGDHVRTLVEVDGVRHILEGVVETFPDKLSEEKRSEVMPLDVWLQIYAGRDKDDFEDRIEYHGPEEASDEADYLRVTDNLVGEFKAPDLDNVGNVNDWYRSGRAVTVDGHARGAASGFYSESLGESPRGQEVRRLIEVDESDPKNLSVTGSSISREAAGDFLLKMPRNESTSIVFQDMEYLDKESAKHVYGIAYTTQLGLRLKDEEEFFNVKIDEIVFDSLGRAEEGAVAELAKINKNADLVFRGLPSLPVSFAEEIATSRVEIGPSGRNKGGHIAFENLRVLSLAAVRALNGEPLRVDDFQLLSANRQIKDETLVWITLDDVPQEKASRRQKRNWHTLRFGGLEGLSIETARELVNYKGDLELVDSCLSEEVRKVLSGRDTGITMKNVSNGCDKD